MSLRFSTSREARLKHSTGAATDLMAGARRSCPRPRRSTGVSASIAHFTGRGTDCRALEKGIPAFRQIKYSTPAAPGGVENRPATRPKHRRKDKCRTE